MLFSSLPLLLASALTHVSAQNVHYHAPEVVAKVEQMMEEFHKYTNYTGPNSNEKRQDCSFWMESIAHQGVAAFNSNPSGYQVFRNVKDFGAKGDGVSDDTAAINAAISSGNRCAPGSCSSSTTQPAVVYFPAGTYSVSSTIIDYYYTQIIGNPNCLPILKATAGFSSGSNIGIIDADPYQSSGNLAWGATNVFYRQIRNLIIDTTAVPANSALAGIHWPTAQATSIQNVQFNMGQGSQHVGLFIESGSAGFLNDLTFNGGAIGLNVGNQQYTMRNLIFNNVGTAINQIWDWGWTYSGIQINNCGVGIAMDGKDGNGNQNVGSVTFLDSSISNTPIGVKTSRSSTSGPPSGGSLIIENVSLNNVPTAVQGSDGVLLAGTSGSTTIAAWGQGHSYAPSGPSTFQDTITGNNRPASLLTGSAYYARSKPGYESISLSGFISARSAGAKGDGSTDDTQALQQAINNAQSQGKVLYVDHGDYVVTSTLTIPAGSKIVGESYSVILSSGSFFNDINNPKPVVKIGNANEAGSIEWSDMIVSTRGQQQGAILIEYNLASATPSGIWDVHTRIGGFAGSDLQTSQCPTTASQPNQACIAAYTSFHITTSGSGLYLENNWLWVADHDIENPSLTQISIYAGRGLLIESTVGNIWLVGTAVEHHVLYQYQFANTQNIFAGQIQTETPYFQPNPPAPGPFPYVASLNDPQFSSQTVNNIPAANSWGIRLLNAKNILIYGAGHYSFFDNYSTNCSAQGNGAACQNSIVSVEGSSSSVSFYNLNTVGSHYAFSVNGATGGLYSDNANGFISTIALFRPS